LLAELFKVLSPTSCVCVPNVDIMQGLGGGAIGIMTQLIISDLVSLRERGRFMGIIFGAFGLGATLGPVIGGLIVQHTSWRWVFDMKPTQSAS